MEDCAGEDVGVDDEVIGADVETAEAYERIISRAFLALIPCHFYNM